jgi:integrase
VTLFVHGQQHEWIVPGTKAEALSFEARKRVELEASRLSTRVSPSFIDFCTNVYAPHAVRHLRDSTWSKVRVYQVATLSGLLGSTRLTEIDALAVEEYKAERLDEVAASSVNNELRVLGTIMRFAREMGYPCAEPKWKKAPITDARRVRAWSDDEIERLFVAVSRETPELLRLVAFLVNTGCRKGEALACEWSWVDTKRRLIEIPVNDVWRPKSGKARDVPISSALVPMLTAAKAHERWVFPASHGERFEQFPEEQWRRARDAAGLTGGVHQLRHTYASHFLQAVPDLFLLGRVLGHTTQRVTELYSHLLPGHLDRAKDAVAIGPRSETLAATLAGHREGPT